jgi:2-keto-3-deoxy-L-rhamnonate aldolase RhmA
MDALELKRKWKEGKPSPGMFLRLTDPTVVDLIGDVGLDFVMFCAEHVALDFQTLQILLIALKGTPTVPLIRIPWNDFVFIKRVLDIGAAGVLVPCVNSGAEAEAAVAACKYPPLGIRGVGPRRPSRYGQFEQQYIATANEQTIVMAIIETVDAVRNIDDIVAVKGLDAIVLGPHDLAANMGLFGDSEHPQVEKALDVVIAKARAAHMPWGDGRPSDDPTEWTEWLNRGAHMIFLGDDEFFIRRSAFAAMKNFRDTLARKGEDKQ